jgi:dTDP-4-amino-4,6-dideoxygalactose transaminase
LPTGDGEIAEMVRIGREYGNPGDYDTQFVGLNARMSELHAAVALESLGDAEVNHARRAAHARTYTDLLAAVPGVRVQSFDQSDVHSWKDFTIAIDDEFGVGRDALVEVLRAEGVDTRCYFDPPVHRQQAYAAFTTDLPVTDAVARAVVSLPVYPSLAPADVERIASVVAAVHECAGEVDAALAQHR